MNEQILLVIVLVPLAWSAAAMAVRRLTGTPLPNDRVEKYQLLIMVTPILLGVAWLACARVVHISLPMPVPVLDEGGSVAPITPAMIAAQTAKTTIDPTAWLFAGFLLAWAFGTLVQVLRLMITLICVGHVVRQARRGEIGGVGVRFTDKALPPLAWGRSAILLPMSLTAQMTPDELRLIVRHEQAHLVRKDPLYFAVLSLIDALAWFNPFLMAQTRRCRLAAELACDAAASGKTAIERESYARVLIRTLKHTAGNLRSHTPAAVSKVTSGSSAKSGDFHMRLNEIMHASPIAHKRKHIWLYGALAAALVPVAGLQFAWAQGETSIVPLPSHAAATVASQPVAKAVMRTPVEGQIKGLYGPRKDPNNGRKTFHRGIDIAAPMGTPVVAPADGTVGAVYSDKGDGNVVEIGYSGHLKTRMTHLDQVKVKWGDRVVAGQAVATLGNTGISTGPHLHFEVWKSGKTIDPVSVLPLKITRTTDDSPSSPMRASSIRDNNGMAVASSFEISSPNGIIRGEQYSFDPGKARIIAADNTTAH